MKQEEIMNAMPLISSQTSAPPHACSSMNTWNVIEDHSERIFKCPALLSSGCYFASSGTEGTCYTSQCQTWFLFFSHMSLSHDKGILTLAFPGGLAGSWWDQSEGLPPSAGFLIELTELLGHFQVSLPQKLLCLALDLIFYEFKSMV